MKSARRSFLGDESGILTQEWVFLLVICVIGVVAGVGALRDAVSVSFFSGASAIGAVDPGYSIPNYNGNGYIAEGSSYSDGTVSHDVVVYTE
jgi:Flp pilus assembly pilin Flp